MKHAYKEFKILIEPIQIISKFKGFTYTLTYPNDVEIPEPRVFRTAEQALTHAIETIDKLLESL